MYVNVKCFKFSHGLFLGSTASTSSSSTTGGMDEVCNISNNQIKKLTVLSLHILWETLRRAFFWVGLGTDLCLERRRNCGLMPFLTRPMTLMGFEPTTHWPWAASVINLIFIEDIIILYLPLVERPVWLCVVLLKCNSPRIAQGPPGSPRWSFCCQEKY